MGSLFSVALSVSVYGGAFLLGSTLLYVARTVLPDSYRDDKVAC